VAGEVEELAKRIFYGINPKTNLHSGANNKIMPLRGCLISTSILHSQNFRFKVSNVYNDPIFNI
jgi:hypothetical protein